MCSWCVTVRTSADFYLCLVWFAFCLIAFDCYYYHIFVLTMSVHRKENKNLVKILVTCNYLGWNMLCKSNIQTLWIDLGPYSVHVSSQIVRTSVLTSRASLIPLLTLAGEKEPGTLCLMLWFLSHRCHMAHFCMSLLLHSPVSAPSHQVLPIHLSICLSHWLGIP